MARVVKNVPASAGDATDVGSVPGSGRSSGRSTPLFLHGKYHGWRSLVGSSPWGHRESDTTEHAHMYFLLIRTKHRYIISEVSYFHFLSQDNQYFSQ